MLEALRWLWQPDLIIAIQRIFGPEWRLVFETFSLLGGSQIVIFAVCWARWFGGRELTCRLLLATLIGTTASMLIAAIHPTPRPDDPRIRVATKIPISSFPSGHLVACMTLWGTFAAARLLHPAVVAIFAILIGLGRLGLGQHYLGDLLGGIAIGLIILALVAWVWPHLCAAVSRLTQAQQLTAGVVVATLALAGTLVVPKDRWALLGLLIGAALALPLEANVVGYTPAPLPLRTRLLKAAVGLAGIGLYVAAAALLDQAAFVSDLILPALLALWILLGAPLVFQRFGWSEPRAAERNEAPLAVEMAHR
jgi:membrane-associated phospholipid phosphatase